ncbi:MAG TPA: 30S ribosomal protein S20 [Vitreimonas sp.]|nr:30S ribosomal protein S20 [Vitreimonas sp.]
MPILSNAKKALRSSERKAAVNRVVKSKLKTALDKVKAAPTADTLSTAFSALDKAVRRHMLHRNKAARLKSQVSKLVK